ncbi:hypothetical protein D3C75_1210690 [compost metagenome]
MPANGLQHAAPRGFLGCGGSLQLGQQAMFVSLRHVAFHRALANAQALANFGVAQAFQLAPEKGLAYRRLEAVEQFIQCLQGFEQ